MEEQDVLLEPQHHTPASQEIGRRLSGGCQERKRPHLREGAGQEAGTPDRANKVQIQVPQGRHWRALGILFAAGFGLEVNPSTEQKVPDYFHLSISHCADHLWSSHVLNVVFLCIV